MRLKPLNLLDRVWDRQGYTERYQARLVRYADDLVILCVGDPAKPYELLQQILDKLELELNEDKTQLRYARQERFDFLGFSVGLVRAKRSGKYFPQVEPSDQAMRTVKQKIKYYTRRDMNPVPLEEIVIKLNQAVSGWSNYFHYGHGHRKLTKIKYYLGERLRLHLRCRHKVKNRGAAYRRFPYGYLHDTLGLYKVPTAPAWKAAHA